MKRIPLLLVACLCACQPALRPTVDLPGLSEASLEPVSLRGRVTSGYAAQATAAELTSYATVTLLDAANTVVATGLTDASGAFGLNPFVSWTPTTNAVYALDALKSFDKTNDRAALRFRTLVSWDGSKWRSLSGSSTATSGGAGVLLNAQTTALAAIKDLRALSGTALLDALNPTTGAFTPAGGVTAAELTTVTDLVNQAIASNLDPVKWVSYSASDATYRLQLNASQGRLLFDLEDALPAAATGSTLVAGREKGTAIAFSSQLALFDGQLGGLGSASGLFNNPVALAFDRSGVLYVVERWNHRIQRFAPDGRFLSSFGAYGGAAKQFMDPHGISVDDDGNFVVAELLNHRIQKFDAAGNLLFGLGKGAGAAGKWTTPPATASGTAFNDFWNPSMSVFDAAGNIWVGDFFNHRVVKYDRNGNFVLGIGDGTKWTNSAGSRSATGSVDGAFNGPTGSTVAPTGEIYVCDRSNHRVQVFAADGTFQAKWGGTTASTLPGRFNGPDDVKFDNAGNVWVSEYNGHRIQKLDRNGTSLGILGGTQGYGNAQFRGPRGMAFGPDGALWVTDYNNHRVQRLIPANPPVTFPTKDRFNATRGTLSFWFKPTWNGDDGVNHCFVREQGSTDNNFGLHKFGNRLYFYLAAGVGDETKTRRVGIETAETAALIRAGQWHHLAVTWDGPANDVRLYLNSRMYTTLSNDNPTATLNLGLGTTFTVGADSNGTSPADAVIDQFRIRDVVLSPEAIAREARGLSQE